MSRFTGKLLMPQRIEDGVEVVVDIEAETLSIIAGDHFIGIWPLSDVGIRGEDDGFHLKMEGEEVVLVTKDEAGFALAVGIRSASPIMRRRISRGLDDPR
jgi:hypothetical protein